MKRYSGTKQGRGIAEFIAAAHGVAIVKWPGGRSQAREESSQGKGAGAGRPWVRVSQTAVGAKKRYRGLAKKAYCVSTALALVNVYLARHRLTVQVRP